MTYRHVTHRPDEERSPAAMSLSARIASLESHLATLVIALARATGNTERVVRLEFGIDQQPEVWAEDSERGSNRG